MNFKTFFSLAGGALVAFLCAMLHIKSEKVKSLEAEARASDEGRKAEQLARKVEREARESQEAIKMADKDAVRHRYDDLFR